MKTIRHYILESFVSKGIARYSRKKFQIFKNPTRKELSTVRGGYNYARGYIDKDGNMFMWDYEVIHNYALDSLTKLKKLGFSGGYLNDITPQGVPVTVIGYKVYLGESLIKDWVEKEMPMIIRFFSKAKRKNPKFTFIPKRVNEEM